MGVKDDWDEGIVAYLIVGISWGTIFSVEMLTISRMCSKAYKGT